MLKRLHKQGVMIKKLASGVGLGLSCLIWIMASLSNSVHAERRDPTLPGNFNRPASSETASGSDSENTAMQILKVTEIWISDTQNRAIVNGLSVTPGQYLNEDTQILNILPRRVIVKQGGETKTLYLVSSVKTP